LIEELIEFRQHEQPLRRACRHCYAGKEKWQGLWGAFFEGAPDRLDNFDHISCDKYWFISEPYIDLKDVPGSDIVQHATRHGAKVYIISPGYHHEETVAIIVVPFNLELFKRYVNEILNRHTRYEAFIHAPWGDIIFDKAATRRLMRQYSPPPPEECFKQAMDYLTWRDVAGKPVPYLDYIPNPPWRSSSVLYCSLNCAEVVRRDYIRYSELDIDFVFCNGNDVELRKAVFDILDKHSNEVIHAIEHVIEKRIRKKSNISEFADIYVSAKRDGTYMIPHFCGAYPIAFIGIGGTTIYFRLPKEIIDALVADGIVDVIKEWCEQRYPYKPCRSSH